MHQTFRLAAILLGLLLPATHSLAEAKKPEPLYSAQQLQQDFRFIQEAIAKTHPDIGHSTDAGQLAQAWKTVETQLQKPMTRDEAWRLLGTLNPVFADAHLAVLHPEWRAQTASFVKEGGLLFPYEVHVDHSGDVTIRAELGGAASPFNERALVDAVLALQTCNKRTGLLLCVPVTNQ